MDLPQIGLGTWQLRGDECTKVVQWALQMGYTHIDTAHVYENHFDRIGKVYAETGAQVILRWLIQKKIPLIPKGSSKNHLRENLEIFDFSLTPSEMSELDDLNINRHYCLADEPEYLY